MPGENEHQFEVRFDGAAFKSHCKCGWISGRFSTAGLAGSSYDSHIADLIIDVTPDAVADELGADCAVSVRWDAPR